MAAQQLTRENTLPPTLSASILNSESSAIDSVAFISDASTKSRRRSTAKSESSTLQEAKPRDRKSKSAAAAAQPATRQKAVSPKATSPKAASAQSKTIAKTATTRQRSATKSLAVMDLAVTDLAATELAISELAISDDRSMSLQYFRENQQARKSEQQRLLNDVNQHIEQINQEVHQLATVVHLMNQLNIPEMKPIVLNQPLAHQPIESSPAVQPTRVQTPSQSPNYWGGAKEQSVDRGTPGVRPRSAKSHVKAIDLPNFRSSELQAQDSRLQERAPQPRMPQEVPAPSSQSPGSQFPTSQFPGSQPPGSQPPALQPRVISVPPVLQRLAEQQRAQQPIVQPQSEPAKPTLIRTRPSEPIPPLFASNAPAPIVPVQPRVQVQTPRSPSRPYPQRLRSPHSSLNRRYTLAYFYQLWLQILPIPTRVEAIIFDAALWTSTALGLRLLAHLFMQVAPILSLPLHLLLLCPALFAAYLAFCVPKANTPFVYRCLLLTLGFFFGSRLI